MQKKIKTTYLMIFDILLLILSYYLACYLRFDGNIDLKYKQIFIDNVIVILSVKIIIFYLFKLYASLWAYASIEEFFQVVAAVIVSNAMILAYMYLQQQYLLRSIYALTTIFDAILIGGIRIHYRALRRVKNTNFCINKWQKRVMIIGAGDAAAIIIKELRNNTHLKSKLVALIDDDINKQGLVINRVPVLGQRSDIESVANKKKVDEIIIAMPSASKKDIKDIIEKGNRTKCKIKILPDIYYDTLSDCVSINDVRDVQIEDLLGRAPVELNIDGIMEYVEGKKILVTGAGGSIGSELCRQIAKYNPILLVILDIYENNAYDLQNELKRNYSVNQKVVIASVRDKQRIEQIMSDIRPDIVLHAAAHKHVPLMEDNPKEAIKNNVFGTFNVASAADKYGVMKFVMISTDKAVNPTNVMGATKRKCEMIIQSLNKVSKTEFVAVRFGNVLGSNGSVIPLFKKQIAEGGPVTITHKDIIRYFMTIPEAAQLVLQAGTIAKGGEIFILDMGEPVKIIDLAKNLIKLSGYEPDVDISIQITGLRPGEKLYEELLMAEEGIKSTTHNKIFVARPIIDDYNELLKSLDKLKHIVENDTEERLIQYLEEIVPTYKRQNTFSSII